MRFTNADTLAPVLAKADGDRRLSTLPVGLLVNDRRARRRGRCASTARATSSGSIRAAVLRTDPLARTADFEPNYLACIEFDNPDFPWLFTPAAAGVNGRLRPWLVLVVLRQSDELTLRSSRDLPLPQVDAPAGRAARPDRVVGVGARAGRADGRDRSRSRTCSPRSPTRTSRGSSRPRRLEAETSYLACVVPAFDAGRKAGLGEEVTAADEDELAPAWDGSKPVVTLPVYYHWEFATGSGGDFETLARRLRPQPVAANVGRRPLRVGTQPFGLPDGGVLAARGRARRAGAVHAPGADGRLPQRAAQAREPRRRSRSWRRPSTAAGSRRATPSPPTPTSPRGCAT